MHRVIATLIDLIKLRVDRRRLEQDFVLKEDIAQPRYVVVRQTFNKGGGWGTAYTFTANENGTLSKAFNPAKIQTARQKIVTTSTYEEVYSNILLKTNANMVTATVDSSGNITLSAAPSSFYPSIIVHFVYKLDSDENLLDHVPEDIVTDTEVKISKHAIDIVFNNIASGLTEDDVQGAIDQLARLPVEATASSFSTTSGTYVNIPGLTMTPPTGTFAILFSATANTTGGATVATFAVMKNGVLVGNSDRNFRSTNVLPVGTQAIITVTGTDIITIATKTSNGNSVTVYNSSILRMGH